MLQKGQNFEENNYIGASFGACTVCSIFIEKLKSMYRVSFLIRVPIIYKIKLKYHKTFRGSQ